MGNVDSYSEHIQREFTRVKKNDRRSFLTVEEAKELRSVEDYSINFKKLAVLFVADNDKNGKFSLKDLMHFANWCSQATANIGAKQIGVASSFQSELQAQCTLAMWKKIALNGEKSFSDWFVLLFSTGMTKKPKSGQHTPTSDPNTILLSTDAAVLIHEILSIQELYGVTRQTFINTMQKMGEEMVLISPSDQRYGNVLPIQVLQEFARNFAHGFLTMMDQMGFDDQILAAVTSQSEKIQLSDETIVSVTQAEMAMEGETLHLESVNSEDSSPGSPRPFEDDCMIRLPSAPLENERSAESKNCTATSSPISFKIPTLNFNKPGIPSLKLDNSSSNHTTFSKPPALSLPSKFVLPSNKAVAINPGLLQHTQQEHNTQKQEDADYEEEEFDHSSGDDDDVSDDD